MTAPIHLSRKKAAKNPNVRWEGLNEFLSFADLPSLSSAQRVACLAYGYSSHMEMAGHHDYFATKPQPDYSEALSALRAIGAIEQASVLTAALDAVQAASARAPEEYSNRFAAGVEFADLTEFDEAFERCTRSVPDCLMNYVEQHESEFIEWRP
jgi:thioredoxin-like negative regulator of GroEL